MMGLCESRALGERENPMYAKVMRDQFQVRDESIIHTPTGAEFTPVIGDGDSMMIWTGGIGRSLFDGVVYRYAEVLAMTKSLWREMALAA
jgi:hypothetical protein